MLKLAFAEWLTMAVSMYLFGDHGPYATWDEKAIMSGVLAAGVELAVVLLILLWVWALP